VRVFGARCIEVCRQEVRGHRLPGLVDGGG
jgi:hypothetical protein